MRTRLVGGAAALWMLGCLLPLAAQADPGVKYIGPQTSVAVVVKPAEFWKSGALKMAPVELLELEAKEMFGITPDQVTSVMVLVTVGDLMEPPQVAFVVKTDQPVDLKSVLPGEQDRAHLILEKHAETGVEYLKAGPRGRMDIYPADENTLLITESHVLPGLLGQGAKPVESKLSELVQAGRAEADIQAFMVVAPVREIATEALSQIPFPPPLGRLREVPNQLEYLEAYAALRGEEPGLTVLLNGKDEASAEELEQTLKMVMDFGAAMAIESVNDPGLDPERAEAMVKYQTRMVQSIRELATPVREGDQLKITTIGKMENQGSMVTTGVLVGLLLPAVQQARGAARRMQSSNNLKHIGLAMHNYHDTYGQLPPVGIADQPKSKLSWRVHLLPFIEQGALYDQFEMDEPWDSEHNLKLAEQMPEVYMSPDSPQLAAENKTRYLRPLGEGTPGSVEGRLALANITDGLSNTIAVVEAPDEKAVVWTKPDDLEVDMDNPIGTMANPIGQGFNILIYDGSVRFIVNTIDNQVLKAMLTHAGGEAVRLP